MSLPIDNYQGVFDHRLGFGEKPALLVIDFVKAYTDAASPLYAAAVAGAVQPTQHLLAKARQQDIPVIWTQVLYNANGKDGGLFVQKIPVLRRMVEGEPWAAIVDELEVEPDDVILRKQYASCFYGTSLAATLTALRVDTLILAGCSTSGCVRATAVDGMQHGYRVIVPRECVGDRHEQPHEANLFDINAKYGDVMSLGEVIERLQLIASGSPQG